MVSLREDHSLIELFVFGGTGLLIILAVLFVFSLISMKRKLDIMDARRRSIERNSEPMLGKLKTDLDDLRRKISSISRRIR